MLAPAVHPEQTGTRLAMDHVPGTMACDTQHGGTVSDRRGARASRRSATARSPPAICTGRYQTAPRTGCSVLRLTSDI